MTVAASLKNVTGNSQTNRVATIQFCTSDSNKVSFFHRLNRPKFHKKFCMHLSKIGEKKKKNSKQWSNVEHLTGIKFCRFGPNSGPINTIISQFIQMGMQRPVYIFLQIKNGLQNKTRSENIMVMKTV